MSDNGLPTPRAPGQLPTARQVTNPLAGETRSRGGRRWATRGPTSRLKEMAEEAQEEVFTNDSIPQHRKMALLAALDLIQSDRPMSRKAGIEMYCKLMGLGPEAQQQASKAEVLKRRMGAEEEDNG